MRQFKYLSTKTYGHEEGLSCMFRQPLASHSHCSLLHGYALSFSFKFGCDHLDDKNWVVDFGDLKEIMMEELDAKFDHNSVFYENDINRSLLEQISETQPKKVFFVPFIPTAENLAKYWYELVEPRLKERGIKIKHLKVWETPTSTAIYQVN